MGRSLETLEKLCRESISEHTALSESDAYMNSFVLGQEQANLIHQREGVGIVLWVGGVGGARVWFSKESASTTLLDYAQMVIAKGVLIEDFLYGELPRKKIEVVDLAASNGSPVMCEFKPDKLDIGFVRAQLLGIINRFDQIKDDYRVIGIVADAVRSPILSHKRRKELERKKFQEMLQRGREQ